MNETDGCDHPTILNPSRHRPFASGDIKLTLQIKLGNRDPIQILKRRRQIKSPIMFHFYYHQFINFFVLYFSHV